MGKRTGTARTEVTTLEALQIEINNAQERLSSVNNSVKILEEDKLRWEKRLTETRDAKSTAEQELNKLRAETKDLAHKIEVANAVHTLFEALFKSW